MACIFFVLSALLLPTGSFAESGTSTDRKEKKQRIEKGIEGYRINIRKLQEGIKQQQDQVYFSEQEERNLLRELEQIDTGLLEQLAKLQDLEKQMEAQQDLTAIKESELHQALAEKQIVQNHLQKRIKAYYKMGKIGFANVAFSTDSLPRLLSFRDSFTNLIDYDKKLIDVFRNSIDELQKSRAMLNREQTVLDDFITMAKVKQEDINESKKEKEALLSQIKTQKLLHEQAVREMEKAADELSESLEALKKEDTLLDQGFLANKGKHPAPVQGEITALFGQKRENRLGITGKPTGITISAPGINKVQAIYEGTIAYASYLRGYGNTIIIDHGHNYFSIISRLEKLLKQKGEKVDQGELIALTGDTATLMDEGVYFEIRHGSTPEDPLLWLDTVGLTLPMTDSEVRKGESSH
ncbi:MAG: peptidoglycan DD-metalloendopeptidase family protein [Proteobacteria bacterium]|nr:peptidoglycan DD-metalloendopeptidase family protein [Pseudomonadota bacterium]MBU1418131.1 peptidoglycan DD-metalloendopeptidase family protein [Pseudomonadota bacterium]MBU1453273.1 peptidoglycan DD-metalloendopeptidase family protein [Pseudomonadota bacterium]